jgi:phospho-N-acetylmuramoyl-pentapeptide-transferase
MVAAGTSAYPFGIRDFYTFFSEILFSNYLNIISLIREMTVFIAAFVGALIGFLWYNSYPASVLWVIREV